MRRGKERGLVVTSGRTGAGAVSVKTAWAGRTWRRSPE
jgi:hypothetical protein